MKVIGFHPDADAEITDAARYYEVRTSALGLTFLTEVERALDQILMNPDASPKIGKRLRRKSLWRFLYNLVYTVYPDRIRILACAHQ